MKQVLKLGFLALLGVGSLCSNDVSRSYFSVRSYTQHPCFSVQNAVVEQATDTGRALKMKGLHVYGLYSKSVRSDELARYFMFDGKKELVVKEDEPTDATEFGQDILALNFNVDATSSGFQSTITMSPEQTIYGGGINFRMYFHENFWMGVEAPIVHVKNDLKLIEKNITSAGGANTTTGLDGDKVVGTMKAAFKQDGLKYGKIDGPQEKTRLADLTVKIGYDSPEFNRKDLYMTSYLGVVLPTGNKAKGVYMFEPICGNGGHAALMFGNHGEIYLKEFKGSKVWLSWGMESQYLFENTQKRSFDLKQNGPWSRYLSMYETTAKREAGGLSNATRGINLLTLDTKVTPGYNGSINTGINLIHEKWHFGLNYSTHMRKAEHVELKNAWGSTEATIDNYSSDANTTNRFRRIGTSFIDLEQTTSATAIAIKEADIDLISGAHPANVSHMLALNVGKYHSCQTRPYEIEGGASYEFSRQNTSINRWGIWARLHVSF